MEPPRTLGTEGSIISPVRPWRGARALSTFYFFRFDDGRRGSALPAADFGDLDARRSGGTELAADAALGDVTLGGALRCDNAPPAADFDFEPVEADRKVDDAVRAAERRVTLGLAI